jgi:death-on-curing protein
MTDQEGAGRREQELSRLRVVMRLLAQEPYSIHDTDLETTQWKIRLLCTAAECLNVQAVMLAGGHPGEHRGKELVEQVIAAPFQTFMGEELHPDPFDKAAMLLRGITQGHPFADGNKRTGLLVAAYYLELTGHLIPDAFDQNATVEFCMRVSAGEIREVSVMADWLRKMWGSAP